MKRFTGILLLLMGLAAGLARWFDLTRLTDPATGFVTAGTVWMRYGALAGLFAISLLAGLMGARRPAGLERQNPLLSLAALPVCAALALHAVILALGAHRWAAAALSILAAVWLALLALGWLSAAYTLPAFGTVSGIVGSLWFGSAAVGRFVQNQSSYHRTAPVFALAMAMAAVLFVIRLLRAVAYPASGSGGHLCFAGLLCYYMACLQLPQLLWQRRAGTMALTTFTESIVYIALGILAAACVLSTLGRDLVTDATPAAA